MIEAGVLEDDSGKNLSVASYVAVGVRCGLSIQETLQAPVGLILDLWEVHKRTNGITDTADSADDDFEDW